MSVTILLRIIFAHLLSDFVLQKDHLCESKQKKGLSKFWFQLLHSFIHAAISYLFVAQWDNWIIPTVIFITHFVMDFIKSTYMKEQMKTLVIDQTFHVVVIFVLWLFLYNKGELKIEWLTYYLNNPQFWLVITAYLLILKPASIFLNLFIKQWTPKDGTSQSLPNAGKSIGYLERTLILTFILTGNIEGIGFLLAAKSIFRFGELNKAKEIKTTEYVLIGTFASFTVAILIGFITLKTIKLLV